MAKGLLEVKGTIAVAQFWPTGKSDADTASIIVDVEGNSFRFKPHPGAPFAVTHFWKDAVVVGRQRKPPVNDNGKMTIRLQGIDAPELHYRPSPLSRQEKEGASAAKLAAFKAVNKSYRQLLGATATKALHDFVNHSGAETIDCRVLSRVDKPNEVFDTYARFVGDIEIRHGGADVNINRWLLENGWAFPGFYASMLDDEITSQRALAADAKRARKGIWRSYTRTIGNFDFDIHEPKKNEIEVLDDDRGPVIFPKLYRRQTNWAARKKARIVGGGLQAFLGSQPDACYETDDYLENGVSSATRHDFVDFIEGGRAKFDPDGLVFAEAKSKILGPDGELVTEF